MSANNANDDAKSLPVSATVRYLRPHLRGTAPEIGRRKAFQEATEELPIEFWDARPLHENNQLSLETNGFVLAHHETKCPNLQDLKSVRQVYYPELIELVKRLTGAEECVVVNSLCRTEDPTNRDDNYANFAHVDYEDDYARDAPARFAKQAKRSPHISNPERYTGQEYEFISYNVWKPFDREVLQNPLALCDSRTVRPEDLQYCKYAGYAGSTIVAPSPEHRWYYFSRMQPNEILVFAGHKQDVPSRAQVPHIAFFDPTGPEEAQRRSIEARVLCAFSKRPERPRL